MSRFREKVSALPGARSLWRIMNSIPGQLRGLPAISYSNINETIIRECIGKSDPVVLDVGCNDGQTTQWFLEMFESPRIYCFEPDPRAIERFKRLVGERPNVTLFEMAVSDYRGTVDFYQSAGKQDDEWLARNMPEGWDLSGSIKQPHRHLKLHPQVTFDNKIRVPVDTLDSVWDEHNIGPVDFIWMDVQGAELDVFSGARKTLAQTRYLYTEYSDHELYKGQVGLRELLDHLPGFSVMVRYPGRRAASQRPARLEDSRPTAATERRTSRSTVR